MAPKRSSTPTSLALSLLVGLSVALSSSLGSAQESERASGLSAPPAGTIEREAAREANRQPPTRLLSFELIAGTTAPLDLWGGARLVFSQRFLLSATIGRSVYGGLAASVIESIGDQQAAAIAEPLFRDAWVMRLGVGVRPFGRSGPEAIVGYSRVGAMASWDAETLGLPARAGTISAHVGMNAVYGEVAWSIRLFGPLFVRPATGISKTFRARVSLSPSGSNGQSDASLQAAADTVESALVMHGLVPTLSLALGLRFR